MCLACAKKSLMLFKKLQLRWKYRSIYKNAEYKAYKAKKQKDYKNASKWYAVSAMLRKSHAEIFYKEMDKGHDEYYNNILRAAIKNSRKAINIEKNKQKKN
tara:strand:- start:48 stop:350 length:303 start_codon:yes stop_codon:yes gene_type:complete